MKKEITEGNKLIAEFMGATTKGVVKGIEYPKEVKPLRHVGEKQGLFSFDDLKYHESWDWLMPVVEKIENDHKAWVKIDSFSVYNRYYQCRIRIPEGDKDKYVDEGEWSVSRIDAVYIAVSRFIRWYNSQTK